MTPFTCEAQSQAKPITQGNLKPEPFKLFGYLEILGKH